MAHKIRKRVRVRGHVFLNPRVTRGSLAAYWALRAGENLTEAGDKLTSRVLLQAFRNLRYAMEDVANELEKAIRQERRRG